MRNGLWRNFCERSLIMSHDDFVLGYQNGGVGCSVSTFLILRLFLVGRIRETRIVIPLVRWSLGALFLIGLTIIGFLCLPAVWTLCGTIMLVGIFGLGFVDQVGGLIVSTALIDEDFYHFALAERALYVFTADEGNMAGATESIILLIVDPHQGKAQVKLETLLQEFEIPANAIKRVQVVHDRELWILRVSLPHRVYQALLMTLAEQREIYSIDQ
jgi:hypothetical protein